MKNKIFVFIIIFSSFINFYSTYANEPFVFDVTEIEISEKGNKYKGLKRGTVKTNNGIILDADTFEYDKISNILTASGNVEINDTVNDIIIVSNDITYLRNEEKIFTQSRSKALGDGIIIDADTFEYNKILNILNANGNVKVEDKIKDVIIFSDDITYLKNKEKAFTQGKTLAIIESRYNFKSKNVVLLRNKMLLSSLFETTVDDTEGTLYDLDNFEYSINEKLLKGKNVNITSNYQDEDSDKFIFSNGIFDLESKKFIAKNTEILLHKNIFKKEKEKFLELIVKTDFDRLFENKTKFENEPRLYGVSSSGDTDKTIVNKGIFTSCKKNDGCPAWSMKSEKITHDKKKRQLIYKNSILNIYDFPVFYFPKFFHPDPTVKRQSGFLRPQINRSEILGTSIYAPYFYIISEDKDLTFKPQIFDSEIEMFQAEYRQANKNSNFIADFGITKGYQSSIEGSRRNSIGHLFSKYEKDLELDDFSLSKLNVQLQSVTNDTFLNVFRNNLIKSSVKPTSLSSLSSGIDLSLDHEDYNFDAGIQVYESLGGKESDRYQYNFPYYNYSTSFYPKSLDGTFSFGTNGSNVLQNTNNLKTSIKNSLSYSSADYYSNIGFKNEYNLYLMNLNTVAKNDNIYKSSLQANISSIFEANSTFPLIKTTDEFEETISPKVSFRLNPGKMKDFSDTSRGQTVDSIFSINRLGISNAYEKGKSITLGLDYKKLDLDYEKLYLEDTERFFEIKLGGVLRDVEEDKIPNTSTINRKASNLFGSITNKLSGKIQIDYDFAIDNDFNTFEKNSIHLQYSNNNLISTFIFHEENGELGDANYIANENLLKINDNNYLIFNTARNRKLNLTEYYDLIYEYKNDCLTAGVKYRKTYYADRDAKPTEDLLLTLTLFPLTTLDQRVDQNFRENDLFN